MILNHEHESHLSSCLSHSPLLSVFSPRIPLQAVASSLSDFESTVNNQLCCPSPPLTPALFPLSGIDRSVFKHRLKNTACHSSGAMRGGHRERERKAEEEWQQRQTNRERRWFRRRQNGRRALRIWINHSLCAVCVCVLGPAESLHSLIKTLLDDRGDRQTASFSPPVSLWDNGAGGLKWNLCFWASIQTSIRAQQPAICAEWRKTRTPRRAAQQVFYYSNDRQQTARKQTQASGYSFPERTIEGNTRT